MHIKWLIFILEHQVNNEQDNIPNYNSNMFENINSIKQGLCTIVYYILYYYCK